MMGGEIHQGQPVTDRAGIGAEMMRHAVVEAKCPALLRERGERGGEDLAHRAELEERVRCDGALLGAGGKADGVEFMGAIPRDPDDQAGNVMGLDEGREGGLGRCVEGFGLGHGGEGGDEGDREGREGDVRLHVFRLR